MEDSTPPSLNSLSDDTCCPTTRFRKSSQLSNSSQVSADLSYDQNRGIDISSLDLTACPWPTQTGTVEKMG